MKLIFAWLLFWGGTYMSYCQSFNSREYQWHNRLLLVFAPDGKHPLYQEQLKQAREKKAEYDERELILVSIVAKKEPIDGSASPSLSEKESEQLRADYQVKPDEFHVVLIGKDGSEKLHRTKVIPVRELFETIDAMPMRKNERKHRK